MINQKGQITIFILIGIAFLITVAFVYQFVYLREIVPLETKIAQLARVPSQFEPIRGFVSACLSEISKDGLMLLGMQGGFTETARFSYDSAEPTEGDAVQFSPNSNLVVPYWFFLKDKNDCEGKCIFTGNIPVLKREQGSPSIEDQLDKYLEKNLPACLSVMSTLEKQGFVFKKAGTPKPRTTVGDESIYIELEYPLEISVGNLSYGFNDHIVKHELNLKEIYGLAVNLTNLQKEHRYLEKATKQLISVFSRTNSRSLPPFSDLEFEFGGGTYWSIYDIEKKLVQVLSAYIPFLQVFYTKNYKQIFAPRNFPGVVDEELFENLYNRGFMIHLNASHPDLNVDFRYLDWWRPYFHLNCDESICGPESFSMKFAVIFGIQRYNFVYDVSFPVLVDITNPFAFNGTGAYSFKFVLESNLRNNEALPAVYKPLKIPPVEQGSLITDPKQFSSAPVSFDICDGRTKKPISNVKMMFTCGGEQVALGTVVNGSVNTTLPRCLNGYVSFMKEDYFSTHVPIDTFLDEAQNFTTCIYPYHAVNFSIGKIKLQKNPAYYFPGETWLINDTRAYPHGKNESSTIFLTRKGSEYDEKFTAVAEVYGDDPNAPDNEMSRNVKLVPGKYEVKINTITYPEKPVIIPPENRCKKINSRNCDCSLVPETNITFNYTNPINSGNTVLNWTLKPDDLYNSSEISFRVAYFDLEGVPLDCRYKWCLQGAADPEKRLIWTGPYGWALEQIPGVRDVEHHIESFCTRQIEDLEQLGKLGEYFVEYPNLLKPVFKTGAKK